MAGTTDRIKKFAASPQGRRLAEQARRAAADPRRRSQVRRLFGKFFARR